MKKVLSLVLVIAMVLSSFSFALAAPKFEDVKGDYEEAVNTLVALGVITGYEDGTYRPEKIVTRAEMAKLIVEILGYGDLVAGSKSNFADTQGHWADAWIALAAGRGLVVGTGDGKFTPDRQVSYDEAITMVVRALGYTDNSNELKGMTWPTNFKVKAAELKLLNKVKTVAGGADRGGVAQLLFNALDATLVTVTTDGDVTALFDTVDGEKENRILLSRLAEKKTLEVNANYIDKDHKDYKGNLVDLSKYMYQTIVVYEKDDEVVFVKENKSLTFTGTVTGIEKDGKTITIENADEDEYEFNTSSSAGIDFMYNGADESKYDYTKLEADEAEVTVVLNGESGDKIKDGLKVLAVVAEQASGYLRVEDTYVKGELTLDVAYLPKDGKVVDTNNLVIKGDATSLEDIDEDDVLTIYVPLDKGSDSYFDQKAADKMTIIVSRDTVEGRVTKISSGDYYIDGKAYELNVDKTDDAKNLKAGDTGLFYLDHAGKIYDFEKEGSSAPKNYALVLDTTDGYLTSNGKVVLADPKVKVLTAKGEEVTYVIDYEAKDIKAGLVVKELQDLKVKLEKGDLVKYDLNSDKEIKLLEKVGKGKEETIKTNVNSFKLASNAAIFSAPNKDYGDASVVTADDLDEKQITGYRVYDGTEIVVLIVTDGAAGKTKTFGMITKDDASGWDEDEEEDVQLFTAYVNGEKVEYLVHKDAGTIKASIPEIVELTLSNGKLKGTKAVTSGSAVTGVAENSRVSGSVTTEDGKNTYFLSDDVVVYVLKLKDGKLAFDKVGAKSDIRGKEFKLYDTVDNDGDYDIVVVWPTSK